MKPNHTRKLRIVLSHILLWTIVWLFFHYFLGYNTEDVVYVRWFTSLLLPLTMIVTYLMIYRLIPRYLLAKEYLRFALYSFYLLVLSSYIITLILYGTLILLLDFDVTLMPPMSKNFLFILILVLLVVGAVSSINILSNNFKISSSNKELKNKILAAQLELKEQELNNLKSQIHPHFLFNTLNTIYGMALSQSKQTPELILRLSNLLDYILYQVSKPAVGLKEELLHIQEYVELERIRFKDTLKVVFDLHDIDPTIQIAPMILIPFVENAFKHGMISDGYLRVFISIDVEENMFKFSVKNTSGEVEVDNNKGGIGLENIRKRLEHLYNDDFRLDINQDEEFHSIELIVTNLKQIKDESNS